jgi:hypothetical protein
MEISKRQAMRLLIDDQDVPCFTEAQNALRAALASAGWMRTDDMTIG